MLDWYLGQICYPFKIKLLSSLLLLLLLLLFKFIDHREPESVSFIKMLVDRDSHSNKTAGTARNDKDENAPTYSQWTFNKYSHLWSPDHW